MRMAAMPTSIFALSRTCCAGSFWISICLLLIFFFSSRRRHTRCSRDWSSDVCSSDLADLQRRIPDAEVRPVRQFTEGEAKIYNRISGLLTATVGIVLLLTALCVMAAMTNVAIERRMDVGLMKAIGGATRRVVRLFLAEAALLGLAGGVIGAALGILLSIGLGKAVFGVAARPRLIVYPVAVGLTVLVAILSAFPLRRLANIPPASGVRGEAGGWFLRVNCIRGL